MVCFNNEIKWIEQWIDFLYNKAYFQINKIWECLSVFECVHLKLENEMQWFELLN